MKENIIRDFEAHLNEANKIVKFRGNEYVDIECFEDGILFDKSFEPYDWDEYSYNDLFFGNSGFLECIEWKQMHKDAGSNELDFAGYKLYSLEYNKMRLVLLESDEDRMEWVLEHFLAFK